MSGMFNRILVLTLVVASHASGDGNVLAVQFENLSFWPGRFPAETSSSIKDCAKCLCFHKYWQLFTTDSYSPSTHIPQNCDCPMFIKDQSI